jgi:hypothetical protein
MSIEMVLLILIVSFACGFVLDRWHMRLSRSRRRPAVRSSRAVQKRSPRSRGELVSGLPLTLVVTAKAMGLDIFADAARPRRRGDRIDHSAAKRHFCCAAYVAFWHSADMPAAAIDVRFRGQSGHRRLSPLANKV